MTVYALHENPEWWPPFAAAFDAEGVPVEQWLLTGAGELSLDDEPPEGVFWSRMSASAHTRGHHLAKEQTRAVLSWLEGHGRTVVNGRGVLELEMSKVAQHAALRAAGVDVPRTTAVLGQDRLVAAAERFVAAGGGAPFITKHDQGGKGLGVRRFDAVEELRDALAAGELEAPANGTWLLQELLVAAEPAVTRTELVDGEHVYSVRVSTAQGFELCPADACALPGQEPLFSLREGYEPPQLEAYRRFLAATGTAVAGIESIETVDGRVVTYDVNTNTNYNADVEAVAPRSGPREIARYLGRLEGERRGVRAAA
ncbi:alpha-L-glutamate ligase [Pseudokineococcus marinus]|uniref:Alpha-L-glutamate ligase n=1 Tax=Pseudokineococcus marinus TaxID=351215 RepID=A0A849BMJ8_9ACTN|nr:alpha-L-glutamate ligase [Pseudokineococcus marinus]NNH23871.1 alpha-L-glutamate ligase [Pseudokineococcus marinus]